MYIHVCVYTVTLYTCMYVYIYIFVCMYTCVYIQVRVYHSTEEAGQEKVQACAVRWSWRHYQKEGSVPSGIPGGESRFLGKR